MECELPQVPTIPGLADRGEGPAEAGGGELRGEETPGTERDEEAAERCGGEATLAPADCVKELERKLQNEQPTGATEGKPEVDISTLVQECSDMERKYSKDSAITRSVQAELEFTVLFQTLLKCSAEGCKYLQSQ